MKTISVILTFIWIQSIYGQSKSLLQRQEYLKNHHLFVLKVEFEHKKKDKNEIDSIIACENAINLNLKLCLSNFWDLNDSIIYINKSDFKEYKKKYPEHIFLKFMYESSSIEISAFNLVLPKKRSFFDDVMPRIIGGDTSLIGII